MAKPYNSTAAVFDPAQQHQNPDAKITAALDRVGQSFRSLLSEGARSVSEITGLSFLQAQVLVFLEHHPARLARVTQLAREFDVTPATMSDTARVLEEKELICKEPLTEDRRVITIELTSLGKEVSERLSAWADQAFGYVSNRSNEEKEIVLKFLLGLLAHLYEQGLISVARTCVTCQHFSRDAHSDNGAPHHCQLVDIRLADRDLRLDCQEHDPVQAHTS